MAHSATLPIETQTGHKPRLTLGFGANISGAVLTQDLTTELSKLLLLIRP